LARVGSNGRASAEDLTDQYLQLGPRRVIIPGKLSPLWQIPLAIQLGSCLKYEDETNHWPGDARVERNAEKYQWFWDRLDQYLAKAQLKQSRQRNFIIDEFLALDSHVSAEDLYSRLKETEHNPGLATVYRTLNLLKEAGLVDQKQFADGKSVFEVLDPKSHHDHLICVDCHKVLEFSNEEIETLQRQVATRFGFRLTHHSLDLFGHCAECQKKL
jgi:Fur family ferric uptake transcriptional regulator